MHTAQRHVDLATARRGREGPLREGRRVEIARRGIRQEGTEHTALGPQGLGYGPGQGLTPEAQLFAEGRQPQRPGRADRRFRQAQEAARQVGAGQAHLGIQEQVRPKGELARHRAEGGGAGQGEARVQRCIGAERPHFLVQSADGEPQAAGRRGRPVSHKACIAGHIVFPHLEGHGPVSGARVGRQRDGPQPNRPQPGPVDLGQRGEIVTRPEGEGRAGPVSALPEGDDAVAGRELHQGVFAPALVQPWGDDTGRAYEITGAVLDRGAGRQCQGRAQRPGGDKPGLLTRGRRQHVGRTAGREAIARRQIDPEQSVEVVMAHGLEARGRADRIAERAARIGEPLLGHGDRRTTAHGHRGCTDRLEGAGQVQQATTVDDVGTGVARVARGGQEQLHRLSTGQIGEGLQDDSKGSRYGRGREGGAVDPVADGPVTAGDDVDARATEIVQR